MAEWHKQRSVKERKERRGERRRMKEDRESAIGLQTNDEKIRDSKDSNQ